MASTSASTPKPAAAGVEVIDLEYLGELRSIASVLLTGPDGIAIIDPGPSTTLAVLRQRLAERGGSIADVSAILLTHIHLDHAGVTGTLVRENPRIRVFVHARGAAHLVDPSRLLRSAERIYGDRMERLWSDVLPVAADHLQVLGEEEAFAAAGRPMRSAYTPGHAWHHVSFLDEGSGTAFVGDTAGERYPGEQYVLPVTPPPDIDIERWMTSSARICAWQPSQLVITHFGAFPDPARHMAEHEERLRQWAEAVRRSLAADGTDPERADRFATEVGRELRRLLPPMVADRYSHSVRSSWDGLARYWRTRSGAHAPPAPIAWTRRPGRDVRGVVAPVVIALTAALVQAGGPWRVISSPKFPTVVAYDTSRVARLPHGRADVWERFTLHPPRHDPTGVVGSIVMRLVVDCPAQMSAVRSIARYAPNGKLLSQTSTFGAREDDFSTENPGSVEESALNGLCTALHLPHGS